MEIIKLKILRIIPTMDPKKGGVAEAARQSAILMSQEGINIDILCFDEQSETWMNNEEFKTIGLGQYLSYFAINFKYLPWLFKNISKYDLVIIDGLWLFHLLGGYVAKFKNIPYLVYTHGMLDPYFNENKLKYLKKLPFWFLIDRNILNMASAVVYTCEEEKLISKKSFPLYSPKEYVVTLGIEKSITKSVVLEDLFFNTFSELTDKKVVLYLSRVHPKKGLDLLIESVNQKKDLLKKHVFVIAGSGDEKYIIQLKNLIKKYKLENYFKWVGNLSGDLKWSAFYSADTFILPSHSENFGIVVAESLSLKTPVLITNKVNIYHEIESFNAGIVVNDTIDGINSLLEQYINLHDEEYKDMALNAINCFEKSFSNEAYKNDFLNLIKEVSNEK
ncbi:MAG: Glycosyltransferase [uncultured Sulfurovum sp.]|uniref:Glycosyltransferase n=1 Tax=uncultured Sulfurovum sp. TaxID=269237 RepID=A0A6S6TZE9_9BACT|nr:MAG: Glycosyltransferase [uncultured Sulfurovum sp.]